MQSFASEALNIYPQANEHFVQLENFAPLSERPYPGCTGNGFIEISKNVNRKIVFDIDVKEGGAYISDVRYSNGTGPINTENKCAFRALYVDKNKAGTWVFPQRGKEEWSSWGRSNPLSMHLTKGLHHLVISYDNSDENMNGTINQAMRDALRLIRY